MDVNAAVSLAKQRVTELFADEGIKNMGLEEVEFDEQRRIWKVTIGFSRPWDEARSASAALSDQNSYWRRVYKAVHIDANSGEVTSVKSIDTGR